jgi:hypothetical protein
MKDSYDKYFDDMILRYNLYDLVEHIPYQDRKDVLIELFVKVIDKEELDCADNFRVQPAYNIKAYKETQAKGCCGFMDTSIIVNQRKYLIGCNYGH